MDSDSSNPALRPQALDFLITDFGQYLGLEGLAFDDSNVITLEIDSHIVSLKFVDERVGILITSVIETVPSDVSHLLPLAICMQNHDSMSQGLGIVTLDADTGDLVWTDRMPTAGLTVDLLNSALTHAVEGVKFWSAFVAGSLQEIDEMDALTQASGEAETEANTSLFKV